LEVPACAKIPGFAPTTFTATGEVTCTVPSGMTERT
jgi:hypothetical protein